MDEFDKYFSAGCQVLQKSKNNQMLTLDNCALNISDEQSNDKKKKQDRIERERVSYNYTYIPLKSLGETEESYESSCDELEEDDLNRESSVDSRFDFEEDGEEGESTMPWDNPRKRKRSNQKQSNRECFGCSWGNNGNSSLSSSKINIILTIIDENYGLISNMSLARMVHLYFKTEIYLPMIDKGESISNWRTKVILEHIESHTLEPRIYIGETIKKFKRIQQVLENNIMTRKESSEGTIEVTCDTKNIKEIVNLSKSIKDLYNTPPKGLNFYNPDCKINFANMSKRININKDFTVDNNE
jgi:hypothetical protein